MASKKPDIFLVEDDPLFRESITGYLEKDYRVTAVESAEKTLKLLEQRQPKLVLIDINLPGMDGIELLEKMMPEYPDLVAVMLTANESIPKVVECIKLGAYDYLVKPIDPDSLMLTIERALENSNIKRELQQRRDLQLASNQEYKIIGESKAITELKKEIEIVGKTDATVLVQGESGTGKELVARTLHGVSPRASGTFVALNCAAIPKELIESELFGHKKGAFTGAQKEIGKFRLADKGTLLLDEISELPPDAQSKLLRVLEQEEFYPVGSTEMVQVDVRIIASTNKDLKALVQKGDFREDLFFRLNIYNMAVPPLRERGDDVLILTRHFMQEFNQKFDKNFSEIAPDAKEELRSHGWKGNVRELRNAIERIVLFHESTTLQKDFLDFLTPMPVAASASRDGDPFRLPEDGVDFEELEKELIKQALERTKWNKTRAAKLLNLSPATFYYRLEKYGLK